MDKHTTFLGALLACLDAIIEGKRTAPGGVGSTGPRPNPNTLKRKEWALNKSTEFCRLRTIGATR